MDTENVVIDKVIENFTKIQDQMNKLGDILFDVDNCKHESTKKLILNAAMKLSESLGIKEKVFA